MVSLQVWLIGKEMLASKSSDVYQGQGPRETFGIFFPKSAWILWFGVAWIWRGCFLEQGKGGEKNLRRFPEENPRRFSRKCVPKSENPYHKLKSTASSRPSSLCTFSFQQGALSCRTERPRTMPSIRRKRVGGTNLLGKKSWQRFCAHAITRSSFWLRFRRANHLRPIIVSDHRADPSQRTTL